jgi:hypothetical protein
MRTDKDPSQLPQASMMDHPAEHCLEANCPRCRRTVDAVCPKCRSNVEASGADRGEERIHGQSVLARAEFYRRFVLLLQESRNCKFTLGCFLIATGDAGADGMSMQNFAKTWGVGRATVSKHCRRICKRLGIAPSAYMMKEERARAFKLSNRRPTKL